MGGRNADRIARLASLKVPPRGRTWMLSCQKCGHMGALPLAVLIERHGGAYPIESAIWRLRCASCGEVGRSEHVAVRLCTAECPRFRT